MNKLLKYTPKETFIIEVTDSGEKFLFLYFIYEEDGQCLWQLTSQVQRITLTQDKTLFTTKNSHYHLCTAIITYEQLTMTEFLYSKQGYTPNEAKSLVNQQSANEDIIQKRDTYTTLPLSRLNQQSLNCP